MGGSKKVFRAARAVVEMELIKRYGRLKFHFDVPVVSCISVLYLSSGSGSGNMGMMCGGASGEGVEDRPIRRLPVCWVMRRSSISLAPRLLQ